MISNRSMVIATLLLVASAAYSSELAVLQTDAERCSSQNARVCSVVDASCEVLHKVDGTSNDVCRWPSRSTAADCDETVGLWATADSRYAKNHPDAVVSGSAGACMTEVRNIRDKVIAGLKARGERTGGARVSTTQNEDIAPTSGLTPPSDLTISNVSRTGLTLTWSDNSDREFGVEMYRRNPEGARRDRLVSWKFVGLSEERIDANVNGTGLRSDRDYDLTPGTSYCYRLRAYIGFDRSQVSDYSKSVCATTDP